MNRRHVLLKCRAAFPILVLITATTLAAPVAAQSPLATSVDPRRFDLDIPPGPVTPGNGRRVLTRNDSGQVVVAQVHVTVGDRHIVLLPDGQLVPRTSAEAMPTDRDFEPASKEQLAKALLRHDLTGFHAKETRRYLYLYDSSEPFVEVTSRILETMFRGVEAYVQVQGIEVHPPETPLVVLVFRTESEFQNYRPMPEGIVAYYNVLTNRIVMYEESSLWKIKPQLAIQQSISTIAHEGVHQVLHNIGVQQRLSVWPMWLNEGLAEFFAPTSTDRYLKWKGAGQVNDMRMFELEQYIKSRSGDDADGGLVTQTVGAARLTSTGYAAAWALTHYLARNRRTDFHTFVRETSRLGPLQGNTRAVVPGVIPENMRLFKEQFGDDLADLERRLLLHLKGLPYIDPFAEWPHFVAAVALPAGRRPRREANVFHTPDQAERWRREIVAQTPTEQRGAVQSSVRQFPNRILAERFAQQWLQGG